MFIGVGVAAAISVAFVVLNLISLKSKFFPISSNRSLALISIDSVFGSYVVHNPTPFVTLNCYAETQAKRWGFDIWGENKDRKEIKSAFKDLEKYAVS